MNNKGFIAILIIFIAIFGIILSYSIYEEAEFNSKIKSENTISLSASTEGPIELTQLTQTIKNHEYYKGYNNETLKWMESLGNQYAYPSDGKFIIMSKNDASNLKSEYILDAYKTQFFNCTLIEKHNLINENYTLDIYYVKDVEYTGEKLTSLQGA